MSNIAFRDSSIAVIDTGRTSLRAGLGLHDLLQKPGVEIPARVGIRRSAYTNGEVNPDSSGSTLAPPHGAKVTDYLVGEQLNDALAAGQDLAIFWPFEKGDVGDWIQAEALCLFDRNIAVDYSARKYILFTSLHLRRPQNESPVLLTFFPGLSRDTYEQAAQTFFERFNVAGFAILDRASAQLYAASYLTGVVIDISDRHTDVNIITDGSPLHQARASLPIGVEDCEYYLAQLLRQNTSVMTALSLADAETGAVLDDVGIETAVLELARQVWSDGLVRPAPGVGDVFEEDGVTDIAAIVVAGKEKAVFESAAKRRANAKATAAELARAREIEALDLVTITFRGKEVTLGKERHRFCDPLFHPTLVKDLPHRQRPGKRRRETIMGSLQEVVAHSVSIAEVDQRQYIYGGLFVTGEITSKVKGLGIVLQSRLAPFILGNPDQQNDVQTKAIRVLKVPEYFGEYRETGDGYAAFLGASIVAKISFSDPLNKNFLSKADYSAKGPHAVLEMSPSLL